jgi:hypothetical protein
MIYPLFYCLSTNCQQQLASWYKRKYRKVFHPPGYVPEIESSDQIPKIMRENREVKAK